ncbi:hypothetical protein K7432_011779 [Basidiobolus ranarum]|uniref:asparaginase n=1 Tax=Basidiobolus ranarum TaxID=34480 RepID=A0ABR2WLQ0_9FUNG
MTDPSNLLVIVTGEAIRQNTTGNGEMHLSVNTLELLISLSSRIRGCINPIVVDLGCSSGTELTFETISKVKDAILENSQSSNIYSVVLVVGTDIIEEAAFCLDLYLRNWLVEKKVSLVITGSMKPADILGYEGFSTIKGAIQIALEKWSKATGVLVCINNDIHSALYITKGDSQVSFKSVPTGPVGQIHRGTPRYHHSISYLLPSIHDPSFLHVNQEALSKKRVVIWTVTMSTFIPEQLLENVDGLILATPSTGSISDSLIEKLSPTWTNQIPIVIVSRCFSGHNFDDQYYRESKARYTGRNFIFENGYEELNALQARNLLIFQLAAGYYSPNPQILTS